MDPLLRFFEQMPTWHRLVWVAICLASGWLVETQRPLVRFEYGKWAHARVNLLLLATVSAVGSVLAFGLLGVFAWVERRGVGLLNAVALPSWAEVLISVVVLDLFAQYVAHFLLHKWRFLWRFHMVHHSDFEVDATTGTRIHPGDYLFRELIAVGAIVAFGIPLGAYFFYRFLTVFFTYATHANVRMPAKLDRVLSLVFVTPDMHKFHHHEALPWTDTNFGNILSVWDRLFGTFVYDDVTRVRYGLDTLERGTRDGALAQLRLPFEGRR